MRGGQRVGRTVRQELVWLRCRAAQAHAISPMPSNARLSNAPVMATRPARAPLPAMIRSHTTTPCGGGKAGQGQGNFKIVTVAQQVCTARLCLLPIGHGTPTAAGSYEQARGLGRRKPAYQGEVLVSHGDEQGGKAARGSACKAGGQEGSLMRAGQKRRGLRCVIVACRCMLPPCLLQPQQARPRHPALTNGGVDGHSGGHLGEGVDAVGDGQGGAGVEAWGGAAGEGGRQLG